MGRRTTTEIKESLEALKSLQGKQPNLILEKKVEALRLTKLKKFKTQEELSSHLLIKRRTLSRWLKTYREEGISILLKKTERPRPSKLISQELHKAIEAKLADAENPLLGYTDAVRWVKTEHGVSIKYAWLRKYMIKHFKTKLKVPRKSHVKKDPKAAEAFLKTPYLTR